jgi:hypothetical protein
VCVCGGGWAGLGGGDRVSGVLACARVDVRVRAHGRARARAGGSDCGVRVRARAVPICAARRPPTRPRARGSAQSGPRLAAGACSHGPVALELAAGTTWAVGRLGFRPAGASPAFQPRTRSPPRRALLRFSARQADSDARRLTGGAREPPGPPQRWHGTGTPRPPAQSAGEAISGPRYGPEGYIADNWLQTRKRR